MQGIDLEIIRMICRWATTRHRKEVPYRAFTAAAVLRRHCDIVERKTKHRPQLQSLLLTFLEKDRSEDGTPPTTYLHLFILYYSK